MTKITVNAEIGHDIREAIADALSIAAKLKLPVTLVFNDLPVLCDPDRMNEAGALRLWELEHGKRAAEEALKEFKLSRGLPL